MSYLPLRHPMASRFDGLVDPRLGTRIIAEARLQRYERKIERAIKTALAIQKAKVMATINTQYMTAAAPPDAFDINSFDTAVTDEVLPIISDVLGDMSTKVFNFLNLPPETRSQILGKIDVTSRTNSFVSKVNHIGPDVAQKIMDELTIGAGKGESYRELTKRIDGAFDYANNVAARIARTETHGAVESTKHDSASAIANAGYDMTHSWVATADESTRPSHVQAEIDGQNIPLNQPFQVGDEELMHPGDEDGSAAETANCRCAETFDVVGRNIAAHIDTSDAAI